MCEDLIENEERVGKQAVVGKGKKLHKHLTEENESRSSLFRELNATLFLSLSLPPPSLILHCR